MGMSQREQIDRFSIGSMAIWKALTLAGGIVDEQTEPPCWWLVSPPIRWQAVQRYVRSNIAVSEDCSAEKLQIKQTVATSKSRGKQEQRFRFQTKAKSSHEQKTLHSKLSYHKLPTLFILAQKLSFISTPSSLQHPTNASPPLQRVSLFNASHLSHQPLSFSPISQITSASPLYPKSH
jgi:hypothetical protein